MTSLSRIPPDNYGVVRTPNEVWHNLRDHVDETYKDWFETEIRGIYLKERGYPLDLHPVGWGNIGLLPVKRNGFQTWDRYDECNDMKEFYWCRDGVCIVDPHKWESAIKFADRPKKMTWPIEAFITGVTLVGVVLYFWMIA